MHFSFSLGGAFGILFFLMFAAVFGFAIFTILHKVSEEVKNSQAPVQTVAAKIVSKRTEISSTSGSMDANGMMTSGTTSTSHYVTFEAPDGSRLELKVKGSEYGLLAEGDCGELTYQRKRFVGFNRQAAPGQMLSAQQLEDQIQMQNQKMLDQAMHAQMMFGQTLPQQSAPDKFIKTDEEQRAQF